MANKEIRFRLVRFSGNTNLTAFLYAQASQNIANGAGDACTHLGNGLFSFIYEESIVSYLDLSVFEGANLKAEGGKLYIESDVEGVYIVDNPAGLSAQISAIPALVWAYATRTLSSSGIAAIVAAIQAYLFGAGARTITITVTNGTTPLEGALVRVSSGGAQHSATTNVSGQVTFNLDDLTWTVAITKAQHSFAGASLVVSGSTSPPTYAMTLTTVSPPPAANTCRIAFKLVRGVTPVPGAQVRIELVDKKATIPDGAETVMVASITTDGSAAGEFVLPYSSAILFGSGTYQIQARDPVNGQICHERLFTVPDLPNANYYQLPNAAS